MRRLVKVNAVQEAEMEQVGEDDDYLWFGHENDEDFDSRLTLESLSEGQEMDGIIVAQLLDYGILVDVGAHFDGLVQVHQLDWFDVRDAPVACGTKVIVRVQRIHTDIRRFIFPIELELVAPDISAFQMEKPREYPPVRFFEEDEDLTVDELGVEINRDVIYTEEEREQEKSLDVLEILKKGNESGRAIREAEEAAAEEAAAAQVVDVKSIQATDDDDEDEDEEIAYEEEESSPDSPLTQAKLRGDEALEESFGVETEEEEDAPRAVRNPAADDAEPDSWIDDE
ncbi:hypothetical protein CYMTET_35270 [Cymbomonas tetramitiformis]|uniref:S1 motif domain-containing protein n=1 Tax=Cymbomonas tetramitiformis TaxID=36881 RepID=A0AAE0F9V9_9CHLO|nr:hypothetical protein CYMTET_35270 [Cymbomonas tetramitiformis]|eukprot:gene5886-7087_t